MEQRMTRAEGPAANSLARERETARPRIRGPKDRHSVCAVPSALMVVRPSFSASEGVKNSANDPRLTGIPLPYVARVIRPARFTSADLPIIH
jgi:hypothetical protein